MRRKAYILVLILLITSVFTRCGSSDSRKKSSRPVRIESIVAQNVDSPFSFTATVNPYEQLDLSFKVFGYIKEISQVKGADGRMRDIQEGDFLTKGTALARVDPDEYIAKVVEAKAQVAEARASLEKGTEDFNRAKILYSTQSIIAPTYEKDRKEYQVAKAQLEGALAKLAQAEINLSYCALSPPMSGVILKRNIEVGSLVRPETVGFVLADVSSVKVLFAVPDIMLGDVRLGQELGVTSESFPDTVFVGRVTEIAPAANTRSRVFNVEITIPNSEDLLKPGMIASLNLIEGESDVPVILVPLNSVVRSKTDPSGFAVFVVEESDGKTTARIRDVQLGSVYGNRVSVYEGLELGEKVIATGATLVVDGEEVTIIP